MSEKNKTASERFLSYQRHQLYFAFAVIFAALILTPAPPGGDCVSFLGWKIPVLCPHRLLLNSQCPGCGLIRSFAAIAHGQIAESLKFHRLGLVLFVVVATQIPLRLYLIYKGPLGVPSKIDRLIRYSAPILGLLLIVSWLDNQFKWF